MHLLSECVTLVVITALSVLKVIVINLYKWYIHLFIAIHVHTSSGLFMNLNEFRNPQCVWCVCVFVWLMWWCLGHLDGRRPVVNKHKQITALLHTDGWQESEDEQHKWQFVVVWLNGCLWPEMQYQFFFVVPSKPNCTFYYKTIESILFWLYIFCIYLVLKY